MQKKKAFSGYPGDCSPEQLHVLAQFRVKVQQLGCVDPTFDDTYLLRFLRARKFDLGKATEMWSNHIKWRKDNNIDETLHMKFPEIDQAKQFYPHGWFRTDKMGRPIYIERVGKLNVDKVLKVISAERLQLHYIHGNEKLLKEIFPACSKARGEPVNNTFYIMDLKGAAANMMSSKVWDLLKTASRIGQDYYPEILGHMFIVNAPMFFYGVWNVAKHFVDDKTRSKIHIFGGGYKKELLRYVDEKDLPDFLGGKCTVEDYGANMTKEQGPWVSEEINFQSGMAAMKPVQVAKEPEVQNEKPPSIELSDADDSEEGERNTHMQSLPVLARGCNSIEELGDMDTVDIGQESPLKVGVKSFKSKPSMSFNLIPSLNGSGVGL